MPLCDDYRTRSTTRRLSLDELEEIQQKVEDPEFFTLSADLGGGVLVTPTQSEVGARAQFSSFLLPLMVQIGCEFWVRVSLRYDDEWQAAFDPERLNLTPGTSGVLGWHSSNGLA